MRLNERSLDDAACDLLVRESLTRGITSFHSSSEYETFDRFCALLRRLGARAKIQHVVKLAEPHFGDAMFDERRLRAKVDAYLASLGTERIDIVQWMWRGDLKQEEVRLIGVARQRDAIRSSFDALRKEGKIGAVVTFPYTTGFASAALAALIGDGLAVYLNPFEKEMVPYIERAAATGAGVVAIRPLAAGDAPGAGIDVQTCVRDVLSRRGVCTAVVTYSSIQHMEELLRATRAVDEAGRPAPL